MNELTVFQNEQFGTVRVVEEDGRTLFCGSDVAKALGYSNPNKAINDHCRAITKRSTPISGKIQEINFVAEGDVYRLIAHSKLPAAERFESWVFDEVIPSIRKTGAYKVERGMAVLPQDYASALRALADQVESNKQLEEKNSELEYQNKFLDDQNKILSGDILRWDAPAMLNAIVRKYASDHCYGNFKYAWKMFYKELLYKHSVNLESRKTRDVNANPKNASRAAYKYLSDEEWPWAIESVVALCTMDNVDISTILKEYTKEAA